MPPHQRPLPTKTTTTTTLADIQSQQLQQHQQHPRHQPHPSHHLRHPHTFLEHHHHHLHHQPHFPRLHHPHPFLQQQQGQHPHHQPQPPHPYPLLQLQQHRHESHHPHLHHTHPILQQQQQLRHHSHNQPHLPHTLPHLQQQQQQLLQHHPHHQPHPPHPHHPLPHQHHQQQQHQPLTADSEAAAIGESSAMTFSIYAVIVLLLTLLIITANVLILLVLLKTDMLSLMNRYFLLSLTVSDLCVGLFIAPFSFWTALFDRWIYGEEFCHVEAYMAAIFWIASVYSLTWLSIDHYVAIRKPDRYESIMTRTRCVCWVVLIWVGAVSFCCPPIFGISRAHYVPEAYVCLIDWNLQKAYFATSGLLVIAPPLTALTIANMYVFTDKYQQNKLVYEQCTEINARPDMYVMNVVIGGVYVISWIPLCSLQIYEAIRSNGQSPTSTGTSSIMSDSSSDSSSASSGSFYSSAAPTQAHFWLVWLAIGNSFWKFPVYVLCSHDFRTGLRMLYARSTCSPCCC